MTEAPNNYRPPNARLDRDVDAEEMDRSPTLLVASLATGVVTLFGGLWARDVLGEYREMFAGFGLAPRLMTRLVLSSAWLWWLFALCGVALAAWIVRSSTASRGTFARQRRALTLLVVAIGGAIAFSMYALYLPIFELGQAI